MGALVCIFITVKLIASKLTLFQFSLQNYKYFAYELLEVVSCPAYNG